MNYLDTNSQGHYLEQLTKRGQILTKNIRQLQHFKQNIYYTRHNTPFDFGQPLKSHSTSGVVEYWKPYTNGIFFQGFNSNFSLPQLHKFVEDRKQGSQGHVSSYDLSEYSVLTSRFHMAMFLHMTFRVLCTLLESLHVSSIFSIVANWASAASALFWFFKVKHKILQTSSTPVIKVSVFLKRCYRFSKLCFLNLQLLNISLGFFLLCVCICSALTASQTYTFNLLLSSYRVFTRWSHSS